MGYHAVMKPSLIVVAAFFSLTLLSLRHADAEEGRWKLFGKSVTETLWHLDTETVSRPSERVVAVWVKSVPDRARTPETEGTERTEAVLKRIQEKYFGDYAYTEGLWELDCPRALFRLLYFCAWDKNGLILDSRITPEAPWSFILPGSAGDALRETVCFAE